MTDSLRDGGGLLKATYRVRSSGDASVRAVAPAINGNQEALAELQEIVAQHSAEIARLTERVRREDYPPAVVADA